MNCFIQVPIIKSSSFLSVLRNSGLYYIIIKWLKGVN